MLVIDKKHFIEACNSVFNYLSEIKNNNDWYDDKQKIVCSYIHFSCKENILSIIVSSGKVIFSKRIEFTGEKIENISIHYETFKTILNKLKIIRCSILKIKIENSSIVLIGGQREFRFSFLYTHQLFDANETLDKYFYGFNYKYNFSIKCFLFKEFLFKHKDSSLYMFVSSRAKQIKLFDKNQLKLVSSIQINKFNKRVPYKGFSTLFKINCAYLYDFLDMIPHNDDLLFHFNDFRNLTIGLSHNNSYLNIMLCVHQIDCAELDFSKKAKLFCKKYCFLTI